jgi:penicillin V acylase-like amidase (Ntn superfamily)
MEWYPEDGGYASLAIHAFDTLSGTLDGLNSAGLVVSIMADEEALAALGPNVERHPGSVQATGLHELQVMRWLLDTCATAEEAKEALLTAKQYYFLVPCHYIVADRAGRSFIYENSTGRNVQHVIDGVGTPQVATNFQVHKPRTVMRFPGRLSRSRTTPSGVMPDWLSESRLVTNP